LQVNYRATFGEWVYDPALGLYRRWSDGLGHYDATTLEQVTAANVVVLYADHHLTDIVESVWQGSISYSIEITLTGEGDALLFRDGQRYAARWSRAARDGMIRLINADGSPLLLKPGNTWFQVFPLPEQIDPAEEAIVVDSGL
jgi:hypothetical protein